MEKLLNKAKSALTERVSQLEDKVAMTSGRDNKFVRVFCFVGYGANYMLARAVDACTGRSVFMELNSQKPKQL